MDRSPREVSDGEPRTQADEQPVRAQSADESRRAQSPPNGSASQKLSPNGSASEADADEPLLTEASSSDFERRWEQIQVTFVDDPRQAVREAEALVGEVVDELTQMFTKQRADLERTWSRGEDVSTEDLRVGLQRYRSFFRRLLAT